MDSSMPAVFRPRAPLSSPRAASLGAVANGWLGFPHFLRRMQYPHICRRVEEARPSVVLDIGCAGGHLAQLLVRYCRVIALDISIAAEAAATWDRSKGRLQLVRANGTALPLSSGSVDVVVMSSVLQMVEQDDLLLSECRRVLRENGRVVLTVPVQYIFLPKLYSSGYLLAKLRAAFLLPEAYELFLAELNRRFGARGRGYYSIQELRFLLASQGFETEAVEYCPRWLGTVLYEVSVLLRFRLGVRLSVSGYKNMILYPLGYWDRFFPGRSTGCEVLVVARRSADA